MPAFRGLVSAPEMPKMVEFVALRQTLTAEQAL